MNLEEAIAHIQEASTSNQPLPLRLQLSNPEYGRLASLTNTPPGATSFMGVPINVIGLAPGNMVALQKADGTWAK